ncbi:hypothetical protein [Mycoplasma bradburyae]|uniref:hypothetical protein n=1 Tax=Mycoplasma bradburyae TaxID=2963128 RepID=UPI002341A1A7|nr:hypothetical protein [Mycoplasma bradburyae]MDC4183019.1 hypothetical protein [Mycoplasma bradburyae]
MRIEALIQKSGLYFQDLLLDDIKVYVSKINGASSTYLSEKLESNFKVYKKAYDD